MQHMNVDILYISHNNIYAHLHLYDGIKYVYMYTSIMYIRIQMHYIKMPLLALAFNSTMKHYKAILTLIHLCFILRLINEGLWDYMILYFGSPPWN